jgi:lincosamide and streptogramin A transport system ATP-binding/permease protein
MKYIPLSFLLKMQNSGCKKHFLAAYFFVFGGIFMTMILVENLTFAHEGSYDNVFDHVSFQIDTDWKLGFIGRNGRGKTTFLHLLMGKYEYSGNITAPFAFDYFPYEVADQTLNTYAVLSNICADAADWELLRELSYLQVEEDVLYRPFATLSAGEQTKVLLAAMFLNEGRFLLIDEPTNHLDARAREIVAGYMQKKKGFILVSHDRYFLDHCVDHVLSLNRSTIEVQNGNFSSWFLNHTRKIEYEEAQNEHLKKDIRRLKQAADRTSDWSVRVEKTKKGQKVSGVKPDRGYIGHKAAKMMKNAKSIESRQEQAIEEKSNLLKDKESNRNLKLVVAPFYTQRLLELRDVSVSYNDKIVCQDISFTVERGERIALTGKNGSGKSSLLKLILGMGINHSGTVAVPPQLKISYVSQDTSGLSGSLGDYAEKQEIEESLLKALLRQMDFTRIQFEKDMADFSGGQKKKVLIAASLCQRAHLYLWDEPLNFIDVYSRIQIEELLQTFEPTMLFVEHDAMFLEHIATKVVNLT